MEWFYSDETIWKFHKIYYHLKQILPQLKEEAETGRWKGVGPDNFRILRDGTQAFIVLEYQDAGIYDMTFKIGFDENGFDPDVSGRWFTCEYHFHILACDREIRDYYVDEQKQCCRIASTVLDLISYNSLFAYDREYESLTLLVEEKWAFQKYCQLLDVVLPIIFKYEASKALVTKKTLEQKAQLETMLNTQMEIVEDDESKLIFDKGHFLSLPEDPNTIYNDDCPF